MLGWSARAPAGGRGRRGGLIYIFLTAPGARHFSRLVDYVARAISTLVQLCPGQSDAQGTTCGCG